MSSLKSCSAALFRNRNVRASFFRYLVAGGAGFLVDYAALAFCFHILGWHYLVAAAFAFCCGLVFVYRVCNAWVFEVRKWRNNSVAEFSLFSLVGLIGLLLTTGFMWFFVGGLSLPPLVAKPVTTLLVFLWNYGARKILLY